MININNWLDKHLFWFLFLHLLAKSLLWACKRRILHSIELLALNKTFKSPALNPTVTFWVKLFVQVVQIKQSLLRNDISIFDFSFILQQ